VARCITTEEPVRIEKSAFGE